MIKCPKTIQPRTRPDVGVASFHLDFEQHGLLWPTSYGTEACNLRLKATYYEAAFENNSEDFYDASDERGFIE